MSPLSRPLRCNSDMSTAARKTLSMNLERIIQAAHENPSSWSASRKIDKKRVQRALSGQYSTTLDVVADLAHAAGLKPWQLLTPGLDPLNPPVFTMNKSQLEAYLRMRTAFETLPAVQGAE